MGVSETSATSSNSYDDQYNTSTNPPDTQAADTNGNKSEPDNSSTSDTSSSTNTGNSTSEGNEGTGGDASQSSGTTNTQNQDDSGNTASQQNTQSDSGSGTASGTQSDSGSGTQSDSGSGTASGTRSDSGSSAASGTGSGTASSQNNGATPSTNGSTAPQGQAGAANSSGTGNANTQQDSRTPTPPGTQNSNAPTGTSNSANSGTQSAATTNATSNRNTGTSAPPGSAPGTQGNSGNTPAPAPADTQHANNGSAQGASTAGTPNRNAAAPASQAANAGAQPSAAPDAQQSPPAGAQPRDGDRMTPPPTGTADVQQGNGAGHPPPIGTPGGGPLAPSTGPSGTSVSPPIGTAGAQPGTNGFAPSSSDTKAPFTGGNTPHSESPGTIGHDQNEGIGDKTTASPSTPSAPLSSPAEAPLQTGGGTGFVNPALSPASTPAQTQASPQVLNGATQSEFKNLLSRYDTQNDGSTQDSRNRANDAATADKIQQATDLDHTGYPAEVRAFENQITASQNRLAALPPEMRDYYAGQLAALDAAYRNMSSPDAQAALNQSATRLQGEILAEYNHSINDVMDRTTAIFNHPVGAGYLDEQRLAQLKQLDQYRGDFLNAPDAAGREGIFQKAEQLKTELQHAAANGASAYLEKDRAAWGEANRYADQLVADAGKIDDPSKRYKSIGDGLFSFNTGTGEDSVADRRVLAFTQHLMDDPDLRSTLDRWQVEAGMPLNAQGASGGLPYSQIVNNLPAAGPDYVRDLADQYTNVTKGQTTGERDAAFNQVKPYLQVAEGFSRFMLGMTPLAPLNAALDGSSTLSQQARMGIDIGSAVAGAAAAPFIGEAGAGAGAGARFLSELRAESAAANESSQDLKLGLQDGKLALTPNSGDSPGAMKSATAETAPAHLLEPELQPATQGGAATQTGYKPAEMGPSLDPQMLDARARIESNPMAVPSRYATEVDRNTLTPDENAAGVLNDPNHQHYIQNGDQYFKVKYDSDNETWRAVNPDSPTGFSYPVRYNPQDGTWSVHGDVGGPGGGPLSRLVSLGKYAAGDPRIAKMLESRILKPQNPQTCFLDHGNVAQNAAGIPDGRLVPISSGPLDAQQLQKELDKGPLVLSARNIARPDSDYSGMHTVVLLKNVNEDGKNYVLGVDLDDTIGRNGQAQSLEKGDFGGVKYDLDQLVKQAAPYVDEDTGMRLEMYHRPQERKGIWGWFK